MSQQNNDARYQSTGLVAAQTAKLVYEFDNMGLNQAQNKCGESDHSVLKFLVVRGLKQDLFRHLCSTPNYTWEVTTPASDPSDPASAIELELPSQRRYRPLNPSDIGHIYVCGAIGVGKSTLVRRIGQQLHFVKESEEMCLPNFAQLLDRLYHLMALTPYVPNSPSVTHLFDTICEIQAGVLQRRLEIERKWTSFGCVWDRSPFDSVIFSLVYGLWVHGHTVCQLEADASAFSRHIMRCVRVDMMKVLRWAIASPIVVSSFCLVLFKTHPQYKTNILARGRLCELGVLPQLEAINTYYEEFWQTLIQEHPQEIRVLDISLEINTYFASSQPVALAIAIPCSIVLRALVGSYYLASAQCDDISPAKFEEMENLVRRLDDKIYASVNQPEGSHPPAASAASSSSSSFV